MLEYVENMTVTRVVSVVTNFQPYRSLERHKSAAGSQVEHFIYDRVCFRTDGFLGI